MRRLKMAFKKFRFIPVLVIVVLLVGVAGTFAQDDDIVFLSTQFNTVEESEKARTILAGFEGGTVEYVGSEETPLIDTLRAEAETGEGEVDIIGALHGTFPSLVNEDLMFDLTDLLTSIEEEQDIAEGFVELGKMGTEDYQYYVPWM